MTRITTSVSTPSPKRSRKPRCWPRNRRLITSKKPSTANWHSGARKMGADVPNKNHRAAGAQGRQPDAGRAKKLQVIGLDGKQPDRSFVWIPSIKAVVGGVVVAEKHSRVDGRHPDPAIPCRLADDVAGDRSAEAEKPSYRVTTLVRALALWRRCSSLPVTSRLSTKKPPRRKTLPN